MGHKKKETKKKKRFVFLTHPSMCKSDPFFFTICILIRKQQ